MFITTANTLGLIPSLLRDRMEIIELSSYTEGDKIAIAKGYLIPRQLRENGLRKGEAIFSVSSIRTIIRSYTRESGVRNLEREIGSVCRKVVTRIAEGKIKSVRITLKVVKEYLGRERFFHTDEITKRTSIPGVATGLSWTLFGGEILFIEATAMLGFKGFQLTGSLGEVMQESAKAALSYVRSNASDLGIDSDFFENIDIHLHVPAGAQPKDGPSAGVTIVTALVSLVTGRPIKSNIGMTGEITLRGQVMLIGGIKEKVLVAHRAGLKKIIMLIRNQADLEDLPDEVLNKIEFIFVDTMQEVLSVALSKSKQKKSRNPQLVSRSKSKTERKKTSKKDDKK